MSAPGTPRYPWLDLLETVNRALQNRHARSLASAPPGSLHYQQVAAYPPPDWLGTDGVSEAELVRHEERLGVRLPPSYREFLQVTNGWDEETRFSIRMLPIAEVGWTRDVDPELAEIWTSTRPGMADTLYVSEHLEGQVYLLNPNIVTPDGEWEAWDFANWHPGALEFRSFWDLMTSVFNNGSMP
ncbi:hypothetical protein Ppa06_36790 [Planomonospora parontospora subsp. parontospora]|uniref:Knr4/Smi1-like domain-containing protein n=2 Tax=Planomonospora parontospora TaxID=58119 RepID=A0AA37BHG5_9ACTN|nr:SMI1/KNR4 family protein [Planomonospora parontospora]GGK69939.1 hypothetical protein GCM10010126_31650 [Planomonospora parontospora]GII09881.1 hypothetical protein Ppa06_36790 [Planomonospora parontospora subsp. parontospora]